MSMEISNAGIPNMDQKCLIFPPVIGRYGYQYPGSHKKPQKKVIKKVTRKLGEESSKIKEGGASPSRFAPLKIPPLDRSRPRPFLGPLPPYKQHNLMWNPSVRRGPTLIHHTALEKQCSAHHHHHHRHHHAQSHHNQHTSLFGIDKGQFKYPSFIIGPKNDLLDFSIFLEEQKGAAALVEVEESTQTEDLGDLEGMGEPLYKPRLKEEWRTGIDASTEAHLTSITKATGEIDPKILTIETLSKAMAAKTLAQSVLERMEDEEMRLILGRCEKISRWIAGENKRRWEERRDKCYRLQRAICLEKTLEKEESEMKDVEECIAAQCFASSFIHTLIHKVGLQGGIEALNVGEGKVNEWLDKSNILVLHNRDVARDLLDAIIGEASNLPKEEVEEEYNEEETEEASKPSLTLKKRHSELYSPKLTLKTLEEVQGELSELIQGVEGGEGKALEVGDESEVVHLMEPNPKFKY